MRASRSEVTSGLIGLLILWPGALPWPADELFEARGGLRVVQRGSPGAPGPHERAAEPPGVRRRRALERHSRRRLLCSLMCCVLLLSRAYMRLLIVLVAVIAPGIVGVIILVLGFIFSALRLALRSAVLQ